MARLTKRQSGEQKRLHEQLDFFGAKKKRFISIYANKPHIRLKVKGGSIPRPVNWHAEINMQHARNQAALGQALASQQHQLSSQLSSAISARGLANSQFGAAGGLGGLGQGVAGLGMLGAAYGMQRNHLTDIF